MKIIIVGAGKVGSTLAGKLTDEGCDVTVVDRNREVVDKLADMYDIMGVVGSGSSYGVLIEAGVETADLIIAVTDSDELNLLCCTLAKKVGDCASVARVRSPEYSDELGYLCNKLGISIIINPELEAAMEITRILRFPSAISVNPFAKGRAELIRFKIPEGSVLDGMRLSHFQKMPGFNVLVCIVERKDVLTIPNGSFRLSAGDIISFIATHKDAPEFFKKINLDTHKVDSVMMIGGGKTSFYLARRLSQEGIAVKIIEKSTGRCEELSSLLPKNVVIVNGDGTDESLLTQERPDPSGAFVPLTGMDEENVVLSLYAMKAAPGIKVITKINHTSFSSVINELELGSVVYPRQMTAETIIKYVRAKKQTLGSNIETLYRLSEDRVEAIEFNVHSETEHINIPLKDLKLKNNLLVACIYRNGKAFIPGGNDVFLDGDAVTVVTTHKGLSSIEGIFD
ncbi:MAG: Trk system potassium transporter TrkA [Oscillospiraceae bacterium]|nr:Trk system potassium transporter TrkA [Oscillospiraceae bacterium]